MTSLVGLPGWDTNLLVHARSTDVDAVADLSRTENVGAVFTTADETNAERLLRTMQATGTNRPVMFDADAYTGKRRKLAREGVRASWLTAQHRLGLDWALTDSGYIAEGDVTGLQLILAAAKAAGPGVVATLPLAASWWDEGIETLIDRVGDAGIPVAVMLEHARDPFGVQRTVRGVVRFLGALEAPVVVLRCDTSGIGTLCFGASAAGIGTTTGLRHIFPITSKSGGPVGARPVSALVGPALAYRTVDKITDAIATDPSALHWVCPCRVCYGRSIEWILNSRNQHRDAFRHSVAALRDIADEVASISMAPADRQLSWLEHCRHAQGVSWDIANSAGKSWWPPEALNAWNRAIPATVGP